MTFINKLFGIGGNQAAQSQNQSGLASQQMAINQAQVTNAIANSIHSANYYSQLQNMQAINIAHSMVMANAAQPDELQLKMEAITTYQREIPSAARNEIVVDTQNREWIASLFDQGLNFTINVERHPDASQTSGMATWWRFIFEDEAQATAARLLQ